MSAKNIFLIADATQKLSGVVTSAKDYVVKVALAVAMPVKNQFARNTVNLCRQTSRLLYVFAEPVTTRSIEKRERRILVIFCWIFLLNGRPTMNDIFSKLTENVKYCWQNGLLKDKVGRSIFRLYQAGVCDEEIAQMFESRASKHKFSEEFYGPRIFKEPELNKGDYVLGTGKKNEPLRSYIQYLNAHCLTVAGSGSGKTTASYFKILQIAKNLKGIWLFDLIKREFRFLKKYLARLGVDITILTGRSLRINPLQLPLGVELSHWIPRVADMLEDVLELSPCWTPDEPLHLLVNY